MSILLQQAVAPRVSAVALATVKNELAQPLFLVMMLLGAVAILLFVFLPFNTFGEHQTAEGLRYHNNHVAGGLSGSLVGKQFDQ